MRLSRAGWNNVIIFSVMGFILMINLTQNNEQDTSNENLKSVQSVIGDNKVILTMTVDQQVIIERVGQSWRAQPELIKPQRLEQMMRSWHDIQGQAVDIEIDRQQHQGVLVSMVLAGDPRINMYSLYALAESLVILNHQTGQYIQLPRPMLQQLIPAGLLSKGQ
ncbi:hypothetical protein ACFSJY_14015 [Thalassotalea euphylliae]|uniref:hypothetical protein n=1 Tax=Thalassotalea euphylliae TaxID=1655234 RepID=UPI00363ECBD1